MKKFKNLIAAVLLGSLVLGLSSCTTSEAPETNHKAKTTACLIKSSKIVPGTPEKQLAADLVEAKIVFGLSVREVIIKDSTQSVPDRLLQALKAGCVLMVSANLNYLEPLAKFASEHSKLMVLFVGGEISRENQSPNFRWVEDFPEAGARLAGFLAAGKSNTGKVHLFIQQVYSQAKEISVAFRQGVNDHDELSGNKTDTVFMRASATGSTAAQIALLESGDVAAIFGGKSIWQSLPKSESDGPYLIGSDIQLGDTVDNLEANVQASVERNTSKYVLAAVASLLDREFMSNPLYRKTGALKVKQIELRIPQQDLLPGSLLEQLVQYEQNLISTLKR